MHIYIHAAEQKYWYFSQVFPERCYCRNVMAGDETPLHGGHLSKIAQWTHGKIAHMQDFFKYLWARHSVKCCIQNYLGIIGKREDVATQADSIKNRYVHIYLWQIHFMDFQGRGSKIFCIFLSCFSSFWRSIHSRTRGKEMQVNQAL